MAQLVRKTQVDLFPDQRRTKADKVKDIELKNLKPKINQQYNSSLTLSLKLNKWEIYYLEVELTYRTQIPGYDSYRENTKYYKIVHKYTGRQYIQVEIFDKVEKKIGVKYTGTPRIKDIKVLSRLSYGVED